MIHHLRGTSLAFAENVFIRVKGAGNYERGWKCQLLLGGSGRKRRVTVWGAGGETSLAPHVLIIIIMRRSSLCLLFFALVVHPAPGSEEKSGESGSPSA